MLLSFPSFGPINRWQHSCFSVVVERSPFIFIFHVLKSAACEHVYVCVCVRVLMQVCLCVLRNDSTKKVHSVSNEQLL